MAHRLIGSTLLAPTLVGGTGLAGGTLFDADHRVRPHQTRLQSGGIADPTLSRNFKEEDEVHAAWPVTHPGNRRLGANACHASLVAVLNHNDGDPVGQGPVPGHPQGRLRPGRPGPGAPVQPVVVMETADGGWLISNTLEQTRHRSLTGPAPRGARGTGGHALVNARIQDGGPITVPMHPGRTVANRDLPNNLVSTACTVLKQARGRPGSRQPQQTEAGVPASCVGWLRAWPKVGEPNLPRTVLNQWQRD